MVQRRAARFVKGRYGMYESVTQMLEELTWVPLSKRRENARLILFYKIINNLAMVPHSCIEKADGRTRKNHNLKFRHIGYNVDPYGQSFFPKCISAWFWFWFSNQQDSFTNMIADGSAWGLMCQFRLK